ncbi:MAG TPA: tetratricopeptide repeat protein [Trueperaceae bacterium]|nr:tetratricopeptide repeat protein [Trueperaceae bacterium]
MFIGKCRRTAVVALAVAAATLTLGTAAAQSNVAQLRAEVQANPGSVVAWVALGNALYQGGQYDDAKGAFLEAIALDYRSGDAHYGLGLSEFARGDYQAALFEFTEVTRLHPDRFDGHFNRGVTLARLRRAQEAAQAFREALAQAEPEATAADRIAAHIALAGQLELAGDHAGAADAYADALQLDPENADYVLRRGQALYNAGQGLVALPELTELEARSGDYRVSALISDIYVAQGQIDYAIWSLERALEKARAASDTKAQASTLIKLGTLQRSLGREADAAESYRLAAESDPASWEAQYNLGVTHLENGQPRQALEALARAEQQGGAERPEVALALATAHDQLAQPQEALGYAQRAAAGLSDAAQATTARFIAGRAHYRLGDFRAAADQFRAVVQARPSDPAAHMWTGLASYQLGDYGSAVSSFERAVQLNPNSVEARANLGAAYLAAQRYQDAESVYSLLVEQNGGDVEALYNLGWALYSQNRRDGAEDAWVSSCELGYQPACAAITNYL